MQRHRFTSTAVTKYLMPLIDALVVIDRNSTEHRSGTGLQHFALNLAEERKVFIYTDSDAFLRTIVEKARSATPIPPRSIFSNERITVYRTNGPLRIAADQEAGWGMIYYTPAKRISKAA